MLNGQFYVFKSSMGNFEIYQDKDAMRSIATFKSGMCDTLESLNIPCGEFAGPLTWTHEGIKPLKRCVPQSTDHGGIVSFSLCDASTGAHITSLGEISRGVFSPPKSPPSVVLTSLGYEIPAYLK